MGLTIMINSQILKIFAYIQIEFNTSYVINNLKYQMKREKVEQGDLKKLSRK